MNKESENIARERIFKKNSNWTALAEVDYGYMMDEDDFKDAFKESCEYQAKKMYSEEEIYNIIKMCCSMKEGERSDIEIIEHFEKFKKK